MSLDFFTMDYFPVIGSFFLFIFIWRNSELDENVRRIFYALIALSDLELVNFNMEYYFPARNMDSIWTVTVTCIGYILRPLLLYLFIMIVIRNVKSVRLRRLMFIPVVINTLFSLSGFFTDLAYSYDENNVFHRGPLGWFSHVVMIFYLISILVLSLKYKRKGHGFEQVVLFIMTFILTFGSFMESILGNLVVLRISIIASIIFYYMFFQSQTYKDDRSKKMLEQAQKLETISLQVVTALAGTVDAKDAYTNGHSRRVAQYSRDIAKKLGCSEQFSKDIYFMGTLHDIGKIGIPDHIINKKGRLTDEEYEIIKTHPAIGSEVLKKITDMPNLYCGARWHHEHYDGTGYPDGISGEEIPLEARIIAVADAYDAMSSKRSYRDPMKQADIRKELVRVRGSQLDPEITDVMIDMIDNDPDYLLRER